MEAKKNSAGMNYYYVKNNNFNLQLDVLKSNDENLYFPILIEKKHSLEQTMVDLSGSRKVIYLFTYDQNGKRTAQRKYEPPENAPYMFLIPDYFILLSYDESAPECIDFL